MIRASIALIASGTGQLLHVFAQAVTSTTSAEVSSWVSAGGTTLAVGGLAYIARLLASGHLVAYPVEKLQEDGAKREEELREALGRAHDREQAFQRILLGHHRGGADA